MSARLALRVWLPDRPGMLAAVALRIAAAGGNVLGLEVLERSEGVAVDELMVEVDTEEAATPMCRSIQELEGAGIEEVRVVRPDAEERGLQVISAAVALLETANPTATLAALAGLVQELFDAEWTALLDVASRVVVHAAGPVPPLDWLAAFCAGSASAAGATSGSGVMAAWLTEAGLAVCIGRPVAFHRREQRELDMLARVADRMCRPVRDRIPPHWGSAGGWARG
jgi:hypothetical protein